MKENYISCQNMCKIVMAICVAETKIELRGTSFLVFFLFAGAWHLAVCILLEFESVMVQLWPGKYSEHGYLVVLAGGNLNSCV
jgi:hypothetical protein